MKRAVRRDEDVAAQMDGDGVGGFVLVFGVGRRRGGARGGLLADEIAADGHVGLNGRLGGEDDVRRGVGGGAAGDFVAGILWAEWSVWARRGGGGRAESGQRVAGRGERAEESLTVSMYSPRTALFGGIAQRKRGR